MRFLLITLFVLFPIVSKALPNPPPCAWVSYEKREIYLDAVKVLYSPAGHTWYDLWPGYAKAKYKCDSNWKNCVAQYANLIPGDPKLYNADLVKTCQHRTSQTAYLTIPQLWLRYVPYYTSSTLIRKSAPITYRADFLCNSTFTICNIYGTWKTEVQTQPYMD